MDHKGPEHHYDELESPENGRTIFWQQGEMGPDHVDAEGKDYDLRSPSGGRPYRGQPSEINSEMTERNTPIDGNSLDRGGNPLMEGILVNSQKLKDLEELDEATEPAGLGETHPVKDSEWKPGDVTIRPARDEMLGSVRVAEFHDDDPLWNEVVENFESAGKNKEDSTGKVAVAAWLEDEGQDSNIPVDHLGWDIVDVVEPDKELIEAPNQYSMPLPNGITENLHNALIKLNAWVENPEENGKLRPYKEYWSVIKPKFDHENTSIQIGVSDPHHANIINHVARTGEEI